MRTKDSNNAACMRKTILTASLRAFKAHGFHGARTADIAREAGVSQGTLFRYFPTKRELLLGLLDWLHVDRRVDDFLAKNVAMQPVKQLKNIGKVLVNNVADNPDLFQVLWYEKDHHPEVNDYIQNMIYQLRTSIERCLKMGIELGQLRPINTATTAHAFIGMITFFLDDTIPQNYHPGQEDKLLDQLLDLFLNGCSRSTMGGSLF